MAAGKKSSRSQARSRRPLVFISHDSRDAAVADAFRELIKNVSSGLLDCFQSSDRGSTDGIPIGAEWFPHVLERLDAASDVVCLLTMRSVDRPWILYEAGIATGKSGTPVQAIALNVPSDDASKGPFGQFQLCDGSEPSLTRLVMQLLRRIPEAQPHEPFVAAQVKAFKERIALALEQASADAKPKIRHEVFLAVPMASVDDADYELVRNEAIELVKALEEKCGENCVFYAGREIASKLEFEAADLSAQADLEAIAASRYFVMLLPKKVASSVLFEAGVAVALRKPSLYFVRDRDDLPFLMQQVEQAFAWVKLYECATLPDVTRLVRKHGKALFPLMVEKGSS
jgi:hypothetical protein